MSADAAAALPESERATDRPRAPDAAFYVERIDNLHAELVALVALALRTCPKPTSERAQRYQGVDLSQIRGLMRLVENDTKRLRHVLQQLYACNDVAALHDARALGRNVPTTEPAR